ncbi:type VI secretion system-associated FHA domain protein TagH [Pseudocolwellia agarivorans]|uniref:type VI secretion system-associated FHA domain protein TagH n=1 Tax=Pseudocolwellia agarivorans TaxID=1911682 RepID=UPI0009859BE2|nr:type VI secretion system-associated FHA domain protein TagH [Pseudocolwellia agarivorans]
MELIFEIVSYHRLSPEQISKKSIKDSITLGRSENNDWHLPDPEKVVSGVHAKVERQVDGFFIYDLSTNGLFINRSVEALGKDKAHKLAQDDLLTFGDYEVSVTLVEQQNSLNSNDISHQTPIDNYVPEELASSEIQGINSVKLADDLFSLDTNTVESMPVVNNNLDDYFEAPQSIPEEWDEDFLNISSTKTTSIPSIDLETAVHQPVKQHTPEAVPQKVHQKVASTPQMTFEEPIVKKPVLQSSTLASNTSGQQAFLEGLGVSPDMTSDTVTDQLMHEMGECMKLMLLGLMESLRNRSNLKNEFRVNQTTFQQKENNPLKFSASIDDVFQNLFLRKSTSFLPAHKAVTEAFNDTKKHDIALTAGALGEIKGILSQLDPNGIENRDLNDSVLDNVLPGHKQLRYWKLYKTLHSDITNEISNQGSSALSDDFVRAYDKKINSL